MHCTIPPCQVDLETPLRLSDATVLVKLDGFDTWTKIAFTNLGRASTLANPLETTGAETSASAVQRGISDGGRT
jgi:hypothetical protein